MTIGYRARIVMGLVTLAVSVAWAGVTVGMEPPVAGKRPTIHVVHGDTLYDNYAWMKDKADPLVLPYLLAENAYCDTIMASTVPLQETLYKEMLGRIKETDQDVPYREGDYYYYSRTEAGKQYAIECRRKGSVENKEQVVLDVNQLGQGRDFIGVGDMSVSDDGKFLAFSTDTTGFRQYDLHVKDLATGQILPDRAPRVHTLVWAADDRTLFYTQEDPVTKRWYRVYRHGVGSTSEDELVYEEKDEKFDVWADRSRSRAYVFLGASSSNTSEMWFIPADRPSTAPVSIAGRQAGREYYADHSGDRFYIRTNDTGHNFRLVTARVDDPGRNWSELVSHREDVMLEGVDCFKDHYVLSERESGVPVIRVVDMRSGKSRRIDMPEPVYEIHPSDNRVFDTDVFRFGYESLVTPLSIYDYDVKTNKRTLLKQQPVLGGYDPKRYRSERLYATASDGTKVPISIVYRIDKDKRPHDRPMLLMGYGSYGIPMDVSFASTRLSLLDRGMIFGIAHIRGGGELGKRWHEQGRLMNKKNTFTDFIACADYLIAQGYTSKEKLAVTGRSAGGLLMGAVVNMRPDLFKVVFAGMPFVDIMNTMLDPSLPLTTGEYLEWGNPNEKAAYNCMRSYSPYDNVGHHAYPIMLVRTSLNDSQVMYFEPAKWVAKLRATKTDHNLLLFKTRIDAGGHGGASGRYDRLHDAAFEYAFILTQLGVVGKLPQ